MLVRANVSDIPTDVSCQIHHLVLAFVIVRWWLDEKVLVSGSVLVEPKVTECREVLIKHSVTIVLSNAAKLNDTVHLFRVWN